MKTARLLTTDGLASNLVESIIEDSQGTLWFGTLRGVSRYAGGEWTTFKTTQKSCGFVVLLAFLCKIDDLRVAMVYSLNLSPPP